MSEIRIPDPQIIEMESLDDVFFEWLSRQDEDTVDYWATEWANIDRNALVFDSGYMDEAYGPDIEEGVEVMNLAMSRDMDDRIRAKRRIIDQINSRE